MNKRAQGTIEYLVVIAVIIVIGLIVAQLALNLFDSASVSGTNTKIGSKIGSGSISVLEAVADDESLLIVLSSLDSSGVELTKVSVDGVENNYNPTFFSNAKSFVLNELSQNCVCSSGQSSRTCSFQFTYVTKDGLTQTTNAINVVVDCTSNINTNNPNYTLTTDTNAPTITLLTPSNNETITENEVTFTFQASDDRNISSCTLIIDGVVEETITSNFSSFTKTFLGEEAWDNYSWDVNCTDSSGNSSNSNNGNFDLSVQTFGGGDGSSENPFEIYNCYQLQNINNNLTNNFILMQNVDCSETSEWNWNESYYEGFDPIGNLNNVFRGQLNGQNFSILNLYLNFPDTEYVGLFAYLSNSSISNIYLSDINLIGKRMVGSLSGYNSNSILTNIKSTGKIIASNNVGGITGYNNDGKIYYSSSNVEVTCTGNSIGGLVGYSIGNDVNISNSFATGNVTGTGYVGGLVGYNGSNAKVYNSYSTGRVIGTAFYGGLIGESNLGFTYNSYWDKQTSGQATSAGGEGKTTSEMYQQSTFENWDFINIWEIDEGNSYPTLQWQSN